MALERYIRHGDMGFSQIRQTTLDYFKIDIRVLKIVTGDIDISLSRQPTLDYFKIDRNISIIAKGDIAIS